MIKLLLTSLLLAVATISAYAQDEVYELRIYELEFFRPNEVLHNYLEKALIPALNRQGIKSVGAFEETSMTWPKKMYLLIPFKNIIAFQNSGDLLLEDEQYKKDAKSYLTADPLTVPYREINTALIRSTYGFPKLVKPKETTLYELRIYSSYNEDAHRRKVKMFNESEFGIFKDVGLPTVFFGSNLTGDQMPSLTYMLAFKDMDAHIEAWDKFGLHPEWRRISKLDEYKEAINDITRILMKPLAYSQF